MKEAGRSFSIQIVFSRETHVRKTWKCLSKKFCSWNEAEQEFSNFFNSQIMLNSIKFSPACWSDILLGEWNKKYFTVVACSERDVSTAVKCRTSNGADLPSKYLGKVLNCIEINSPSGKLSKWNFQIKVCTPSNEFTFSILETIIFLYLWPH